MKSVSVLLGALLAIFASASTPFDLYLGTYDVAHAHCTLNGIDLERDCLFTQVDFSAKPENVICDQDIPHDILESCMFEQTLAGATAGYFTNEDGAVGWSYLSSQKEVNLLLHPSADGKFIYHTEQRWIGPSYIDVMIKDLILIRK